MLKVRCPGCQQYRDRAVMRKVGLGFVCDNECLLLARSRSKEKHDRRVVHRVTLKRSGTTTDIRKRVRKRDGGWCRWCGSHSRLEVHHIDYVSEGGPNVMHNLITLCGAHHAKAHSDKGRWQPILKAVIWVHYVEARFLMVPDVERYVRRLELDERSA